MSAKIILGILLLSLSIICKAQTTVYFTYDKAGNRETRSINLPALNSTLTEYSMVKKTEEIKFEDILDEEKKILIYPNPTQGQLKIELSGYADTDYATVYLYTLSGNLLINKKLVQSGILNLSEYESATYLLRIIIGNYVSEWKIIKE